MSSKSYAPFFLALFIIGAWFTADFGQSAVLGQNSIVANALVLNPCRIQPLRLQSQLLTIANPDNCGDPIPSPIDICPNIAGIQRVLPAGDQIDANGNCVPIPPPITCPFGYQPDTTGACVPIPTPPPPVANPPTCTLSANPTSVTIGYPTTLSWTTTNADTFSINNVGLVTPVSAGTTSVYVNANTTFLGTAMGPGGTITCSVSVSATPFVDTLNNGGFEQQGTASTNAYDWQAYGNGYTRVAVPHSGSWSIQVQSNATNQNSGAYQRIDLLQTVAKPVFVGGYVRGQGIIVAPGTTVGASLYAEVYFTDGTVGYWNSVPNSGTFNWRWIGFNTGTLAVQKPIDHIFVVPILGNASGTAYFDDIAVTPIEPVTKSAVTIMFDDGEDNNFTLAKPLLDQYGFKGTAAIPVGDLNQDGVMTNAQVQALQADGWEIVSHAINNDTNLITDVTPAVAATDIATSKTLLQALGLTIKNFAWPFGSYNAELVADAQSDGYTSTRTFEAGDNPQGAFPYDIKVRQVTSATTAADISQWIAAGKANNRWEVIVFHTIGPVGDDVYYTTLPNFSQMMAVVAQSGVPVMTYNQALQGFATVGGPNPVSGITITPPPVVPPPPIRPPIGGGCGVRGICYNIP